MELELGGKIAVVTGGSKGIGLAAAQALAAEGAQVVVGARHVDGMPAIPGVVAHAVDLGTPDGPGTLIAAALEQHGRVDVLMNNVGGVTPRLGGFLSVTDADFERSLQLNFLAAIRAIRAALPGMIEQGGGRIVNVASVNSFYQPDGLVIDYGAAKAALVNASKAIAQELGPKGIRINSVSPGPVATDLWLGDGGIAAQLGEASGQEAHAVQDQAAASFPTRRFTTPDEVAALVVMLASDRVGNVTGSEYVIDGGLIQTT